MEIDRKYKFIPENNWNENIKILNINLQNDLYDSYTAELNVKGIYTICKDVTKLKKENISFINQTYNEYELFMKNHDFVNDEWIFKINKDNLYNDDIISIFPDIKWKNIEDKNIEHLHILSIPIDRSLRTIRDLHKEHIPMLIYLRDTTFKLLKEKYSIDNTKIKAYIHYPPSTYHLHIHFAHVNNMYAKSSIEYSHLLNNVILNLSLDTNYYMYDMTIINYQ